MLFWSSFYLLIATSALLLQRISIGLVWVFLALFSAYRYHIGPDYLQYEDVHYWILNSPDFAWIISEPFHVALTLLADELGAGFQFVAFVYSISTIILFYLGFRRFLPENASLAIATILFVCMLYAASLNGIRQYLSAAVFFYATRYILDRKLLNYAALIIIAFLIHKSAIILMPLYFLNQRNSNSVLYGIVLSTCLIVLVLKASGFDISQMIISNVSVIGLDYSSYEDYGRFSERPPIYTLAVTAVSGAFVLLITMFDRDDPRTNMAVNFCVYMVCVKILATDMAILGRFDLFFEPFVVLICALIASSAVRTVIQPLRKEYIFTFLLLLGFMFSNFQMFRILSGESAYSHYTINLNILTEEPDPVRVYGDYRTVERWSN